MNLREVDFGNEAGDDAASDELTSYFVEQEAFHAFLAPTKRLLVATARRGVGKSALLQWIGYKVEQDHPGDLVISSRGADLVRGKFGLTSKLTTPNDYIHDWMVRICSLVNRTLAVQIGFAASDDSITLVESAELEGYKNRNLIGCLVDRLQTLLEKGRTSTKLLAKNDIELLKRNRKGKDRRVWLIVDDLDATYQKTDEETISLGAFFSACRYLTRDVKGLNIRVSLRTDVFPLVRRYDEATGKLDQYREEISWRQDDFLKLLAYRIRAMNQQDSDASKKLTSEYLSEKQQEAFIDQVFTPKMEWNNKSVLHIRSFTRCHTSGPDGPYNFASLRRKPLSGTRRQSSPGKKWMRSGATTELSGSTISSANTSTSALKSTKFSQASVVQNVR